MEAYDGDCLLDMLYAISQANKVRALFRILVYDLVNSLIF